MSELLQWPWHPLEGLYPKFGEFAPSIRVMTLIFLAGDLPARTAIGRKGATSAGPQKNIEPL